MSPKSKLATAVDAWRRLWSVGANGDNINKQQNTNNNTHNSTTTNVNSSRTRRGKRDKTQTTIEPTIRSFSQRSLYGDNQESLDLEEFGDIMQRKSPNTLRIMLHNINRLPIYKNQDKSKKLFSYIANKQIDVALLTEIGLYWKLIHNNDKWHERIRHVFRSAKYSLSYNTTEPTMTEMVQFGGTASMAVDDCAHRVIAHGTDTTGLGRWSWLRMEGKNNHHLRVVSAYRPVDSVGHRTVQAQHTRYFRTKLKDVDPRQVFYEDLHDEVTKWKELGDHIIIGIDANEDVRTGLTQETFRALGMTEIILNHHRNPPATCDKNNNRQPIDGLFVTPGIRLVTGGYSAFNAGCPSDHRYLWIDVPFYDVFGYHSPSHVHPPIRRLNTNNPKLTTRYNTQVYQAICKEKLFEALQKVESEAQQGWTPKLEQEYNRINDRQYTIRKSTEAKIRHIQTGRIPWSPKLQAFRTEIEIWSMLLKKRKGRKVSNRKLRRLLTASSITDASSHKTIPQLEDKLDAAYTRYKQAKQEATIWREEFLEDIARSKAKAKGTDPETEVKQLKTIEQQRTVARNIKRMQGKLSRTATTKIYVNTPQGRQIKTSKDAIEDACITENLQRFSQSNNTPPMTEPLLTDLGYLADTPEAQMILDGTYQAPPGTDYYTTLLLNELRMPDSIRNDPMPQTTVTPTQNQQAWKRQKEQISSEPEGLTFSHYKASAQHPDLNQFDAMLRSLPYQHGFSPSHWQEITDVEILKKAGDYDIEKMRTITLMDAAFNMNNKQLGRDLLNHAEKHNALAREQYGSRKNHQSSTAATNKVLTMDLLRLRRQAGALCSNDAKSCYDRVVHSIASLSMRRLGAPSSAIQSLLTTLQLAKHKIRTAFGVSQKWFGRLCIPLQGLGQGNGVSPTAWAVISTVLINMMRTAGFGIRLNTCLSLTALAFLCYAFVDDTDLVHTGSSVNTTGQSIIQDMRRFLRHWEGGLRATGGALRVDKSYWYLIDFKWCSNSWQYASKTDVPGDIHVRDADDTIKKLTRLEPYEARETLGIFIAMDGNQEAQVEHLRNKANLFAEQIRTGFVSKEEAWHSLHTTIMKTLEYPMEAINLTKPQWDYVMSPILQSVLPRSGIVRTFPRVVVYSPKLYSGLGLMHPFYRQHLKHLVLVLRETQKEDITADLLAATIEQLRLESGLPCHNSDWQLASCSSYLTSCWIHELLGFCHDHKIQLHDACPKLQAHTTDDIFLMQAFIDASYDPITLRYLNDCRMFLRVITLSDIVTADRKFISYDSFHGTPLTRFRHLEWPRQPDRLSNEHWRLWQKALNKCFLLPNSNRVLRKGVGQWLPTALDDWFWFYCPIDNRLYHKEGPFYQVYSRTGATNLRTTSSRYSLLSMAVNIPSNCKLATVSKVSPLNYRITGIAEYPSLPPASTPHPSSMTLEEIFLSQPKEDRWAIHTFHSPDDGHSLAMAIIQGCATAVSDGSYKSNIGTSGFILRGISRSLSAYGTNIVPGNPEEQSAYRSELAGIEGSLAVIAAVCKKYTIENGSITIALDGQQALLQSSSTYNISPTSPDFDILTDIRSKLIKLPVEVHWKWIEGHQDDHRPFHMLEPIAQDNVLADCLARHQLNQCLQLGHVPSPQHFGDEGWSISIEGRKLSHLNLDKIYSHLWANHSIAYWAKKHKITHEKALSIDWDVCGEAIQSLSFPKHRRTVKHAAGHFGVGEMMLKWKFQDHKECPLCREPETPTHVLQCKDARAHQVWKTTLSKLDTWLHSAYTDPDLHQAIIRHLTSWQSHRPLPHTSSLSPIQSLVNDQSSIGWYPFLMGRLSRQWQQFQQKFYTISGRRNTGRKWAKLLVIHLFNISWDMWDHRNNIKHNTPTAAKLRALKLLDDRIRAEYVTGNTNLLPRDKRLLQTPLQTVLSEYTAIEKEQWLATLDGARWKWKHRRESTQHALAASRSLFRNWLLPPSSQPTPSTTTPA